MSELNDLNDKLTSFAYVCFFTCNWQLLIVSGCEMLQCVYILTVNWGKAHWQDWYFGFVIYKILPAHLKSQIFGTCSNIFTSVESVQCATPDQNMLMVDVLTMLVVYFIVHGPIQPELQMLDTFQFIILFDTLAYCFPTGLISFSENYESSS